MLEPEVARSLSDTTRVRDVLVVGGGITGLAAGLTAAEAGADVLLVETGDQLGGTFRFSGGGIAARTDFETLRAHVPDGDPELQRLLTTNLRADLEWLHRVPTPMGPLNEGGARGAYRGMPATLTDAGVAQTAYPPGFAVVMGRKIGHAGGEVLGETSVRAATPDGEAWRVELESADGTTTTVRTRSVVLCGGGFANNDTYMRQYMNFDPSLVWARNSGYSSGIALDIAAANGGAIAGGMHTFYGHSLPAPPAKFSPEEFLAVTQNYGAYTPTLNVHGRRFVDEAGSLPPLEEDLVQASAVQPGGVVYYIFDQAIHRDYIETRSAQGMPGRDFADKLEAARQTGGPVWSADTLDELVARVGDAFTDPAQALASLGEYNDAATAGTTDKLAIPKSGGSAFGIPLAHPPYYAVAVRAGVTLTMGGVRIDTRTQVLTEVGTPIPGLYAAGADAGNIHNFHYCGGNATGLVTGRIAAQEAARFATSTS